MTESVEPSVAPKIPKKSPHGTDWLWISLGISFLLCVGWGTIKDAMDKRAPTQISTATAVSTIASKSTKPTPVVVETATVLAPSPDAEKTSFEQMCHIDASNMTDLQIEAYADTLKGTHVENWKGYVFNASERSVEIAMTAKEDAILWTRDIELRGIPVSLAGRLNVNQAVTFTGDVKEADVFLRTICNPLVIENVTLGIQ